MYNRKKKVIRDIELTIIIPVVSYDEIFLQRIEDILSQIEQKTELVFLNYTRERLLRKGKGNNLKVIDIESPHLKHKIPLETVIKTVQGKYLLFLEQDAIYESLLISKSYHKAIATDSDIIFMGANSSEVLSVSDYNINHDIRGSLLPAKRVFSFLDCPGSIFCMTPMYIWNKLFRRELVFSCLDNAKLFDFYDPVSAFFFIKADKISYMEGKYISYTQRHLEKARDYSLIWQDIMSTLLKLELFLKQNNSYQLVEKSFLNLVMEYALLCMSYKEPERSFFQNYFLKNFILKYNFMDYPQGYYHDNAYSITKFKKDFSTN